MKKIALFLILNIVGMSILAQVGPGGVSGPGQRDCPVYVNKLTAQYPCHMSNGNIIIGEGVQTRGFEGFMSADTAGDAYARVCNLYKETFGDAVNVYCMLMPTGCEFYTPDSAVIRNWSHSQRPTILHVYNQLRNDVVAVDCYSLLAQHAAEGTYLRTDHHWAPLGGYYTAMALAKAAKVPFPDLSAYDKQVIPGYVGTMGKFSKDTAIIANPEDFVYYTPKDTNYVTTQIILKLDDAATKVIGCSEPQHRDFFKNFKKRKGIAYLTFMGGDSYITKVQTAVKNGRRVMLIKDSYGNTVPGYLFYSFEEVHVIDSRYFHINMQEYVHDNKITDIVLCNNVASTCVPKICNNVKTLLTQETNSFLTANETK